MQEYRSYIIEPDGHSVERIELRIGIHVGDIVIEENDIFIAVRLEGIAEPGGISISDDARRQIRDRDAQGRPLMRSTRQRSENRSPASLP